MANTFTPCEPQETIISARITALVVGGMDAIAALKAVCGADAVDAMIANLYAELRAKAGR